MNENDEMPTRRKMLIVLSAWREMLTVHSANSHCDKKKQKAMVMAKSGLTSKSKGLLVCTYLHMSMIICV